MTRLVNVAAPVPSVVRVSVPPSVPAALVSDAVTTTPLRASSAPVPSTSCTAGCWASAVPLTAADEGWVLMASVGVPSAIGAEVTWT